MCVCHVRSAANGSSTRRQQTKSGEKWVGDDIPLPQEEPPWKRVEDHVVRLPFALRALHAELPQWLDRTPEALSRLQHLLGELQAEAATRHTAATHGGGAVTAKKMTRHCLLLGKEAVRPLKQFTASELFAWKREIVALLASICATPQTQRGVMYCLQLAKEATAAERRQLLSRADSSELVADALARAARILVRVGNLQGAEAVHVEMKRALPQCIYLSPRLRLERCFLLIAQGPTWLRQS